MKRKYKNPPIQEAVCEIHFALPVPLTIEQIKPMGEIWKAAYPKQQRVEERNIEVKVNLGQASVDQSSSGHRLIARSEDNRKIAQLSSQFLAVNQLKPYPGWAESFRADIHARLKDVVDMIHADRIRLINLQYIDRLDLPQRPVVWSDWLSFPLPVPKSIPNTGGMFQSHFQQQLESDIVVAITVVTLPQESDKVTSLIFNTIVVWNGSAAIDDCPKLLVRVHDPHPGIFDELVTPNTQELLGGYESV